MKLAIAIGILGALLFLVACSPSKECGVETMYTKEGFKIIDDQACIVGPVAVVTPSDAQTPTVSGPPVSEPPTHDRVKSNAGRGNGSEGNPDQDPGNSGGHNKGGD